MLRFNVTLVLFVWFDRLSRFIERAFLVSFCTQDTMRKCQNLLSSNTWGQIGKRCAYISYRVQPTEKKMLDCVHRVREEEKKNSPLRAPFGRAMNQWIVFQGYFDNSTKQKRYKKTLWQNANPRNFHTVNETHTKKRNISFEMKAPRFLHAIPRSVIFNRHINKFSWSETHTKTKTKKNKYTSRKNAMFNLQLNHTHQIHVTISFFYNLFTKWLHLRILQFIFPSKYSMCTTTTGKNTKSTNCENWNSELCLTSLFNFIANYLK